MTSNEMPLEIWAVSRPQDVGDRFTKFHCYYDQVKYLLATPDKVMIDRAELERVRTGLQAAEVMLPYNTHLEDMAHAAIAEALQILAHEIDK